MDRLGILAGTAVAGLWGYLVLRFGPTGRSVETRTGVD
jgi:hypothetical protein